MLNLRKNQASKKMTPSGMPDKVFLRDHCVVAAPVAWARFPDYQAGLDHPVDQTGDAAAGQQHRVRQLAHAQT